MLDTIRWDGNAVALIDQRILPTEEEYVICRSPEEVARAVTDMIDDHHQLVEGSAGVALAAATQHAARAPGSRIAAVSCGANVSSATLQRMINAATGASAEG